MKILILAAMDKELMLLENLIENLEEIKLPSSVIKKGEINIHEIYLAKCGIGKVNAALNCQILIDTIQPDLMINSGVAGGAGLPVGTLLMADRVCYDDVWCGPGTNYGQADGFPLFMLPCQSILKKAKNLFADLTTGLICTGDKFITTAEEIKFIKSKFPDVMAVDMESAALAQTCIKNSVEFLIIRVVSDTPGQGDNISQYLDFWQVAPKKNFEIIKDLIFVL